jgi:hypothetical protein
VFPGAGLCLGRAVCRFLGGVDDEPVLSPRADERAERMAVLLRRRDGSVRVGRYPGLVLRDDFRSVEVGLAEVVASIRPVAGTDP